MKWLILGYTSLISLFIILFYISYKIIIHCNISDIELLRGYVALFISYIPAFIFGSSMISYLIMQHTRDLQYKQYLLDEHQP